MELQQSGTWRRRGYYPRSCDELIGITLSMDLELSPNFDYADYNKRNTAQMERSRV